MTLYWLECGGGNVHVVGPCPYCEATDGGVVIGTVSGSYKGVATANCADCGKTVDYYIDAVQGRVWSLASVKVKRGDAS
jgi:hypothetical protein